MRIKLSLVLILSILCCCSSCVSFPKSEFGSQPSKLNPANVNQLNGDYQLYPTKKCKENVIVDGPWKSVDIYRALVNEQWMEADPLSQLHYKSNSYLLRLKYLSAGELSIKLYENEDLIKQTLVFGRLKNGMFYLDGKDLECRGVPFLFGGCSSRKIRIARSASGRLIVSTSSSSFGGMLLFMAASASSNSCLEYESIN